MSLTDVEVGKYDVSYTINRPGGVVRVVVANRGLHCIKISALQSFERSYIPGRMARCPLRSSRPRKVVPVTSGTITCYRKDAYRKEMVEPAQKSVLLRDVNGETA